MNRFRKHIFVYLFLVFLISPVLSFGLYKQNLATGLEVKITLIAHCAFTFFLLHFYIFKNSVILTVLSVLMAGYLLSLTTGYLMPTESFIARLGICVRDFEESLILFLGQDYGAAPVLTAFINTVIIFIEPVHVMVALYFTTYGRRFIS